MSESKQKLPSGMTSTRKGLSAQDIQSIIGACGASGVAVLKFGSLYVRFAPKSNQAELPPDLSSPPAVSAETVPAPEPASDLAATQKTESERSLVQSEAQLREDQLAEMWLTNPVEAEKLLLQTGELEDADESDDEEA